uniref:Uncharacterized protein n=1 Tax=Chromera velia CCMP2878 TaxID=1169474 RepID=A0A0G4H8C4_9ALVE|eukprot:Cvel_25111.t1-p1 / transcript=Cvel_25111.t1 / gene=Cvel_25111 / organism=Chromera_velia_CCMP2878 / gene_product=hypothetical protein / transcript_product=hypothetical protein / location=Cvel_scaffold2802:11175-12572(+) / protein_length=177 / sequence_SO=supercontig / SO=protein_coding / is_pseudo=false
MCIGDLFLITRTGTDGGTRKLASLRRNLKSAVDAPSVSSTSKRNLVESHGGETENRRLYDGVTLGTEEAEGKSEDNQEARETVEEIHNDTITHRGDYKKDIEHSQDLPNFSPSLFSPEEENPTAPLPKRPKKEKGSSWIYRKEDGDEEGGLRRLKDESSATHDVEGICFETPNPQTP